MTTYNIAGIRAALKTILTAVTGVQKVYDYMNPQIEGYPAVMFDVSNEDASILDDVNNTRVITFKIYVAVELTVKGTTGGKDLLDTVSVAVINALELQSNQTLGGYADWTMPVVGNRDQSNSPEGNYFYQELLLRVYVASTTL